MIEQITMDVYIDKNENIILAPYKECEAGYGVVVEPVMYIERQEWNNISQYILDLLSEILKAGCTAVSGSDWKKISVYPIVENVAFKMKEQSGESFIYED